jgi:hypothetical protein
MNDDEMVALLSREHPENPVLGSAYPHITHWRCPNCGLSYRIAGAKQREWCSEEAHPLQLLTKPQQGKTPDNPATNRLP